jgi:hypothetical protein
MTLTLFVFSTVLAIKKSRMSLKKDVLDISIMPPRTKNLSPSFYVLFDTTQVFVGIFYNIKNNGDIS